MAMDDSGASATHFRKVADPYHRAIERLVLLTDGVYAIALTLLALEIHLSDRWDGSISGLQHSLTAPLIAYFFSFLILSVSWIQNQPLLAVLRRIDAPAIGLHFANLAFVALMPAAISALTAHFNAAGIAIYAACTAMIKVFEAAFWAYVALMRSYVDTTVSQHFRVWKLIEMISYVTFVTATIVVILAGGAVSHDLTHFPSWAPPTLLILAAIQLLTRRQLRRRRLPQPA